MRYCPDCGEEISAQEHACPVAAIVKTDEIAAPKKWSVMAIVVFSLSIPLLALNVLFTAWYFTIDELGFLFVGVVYLCWAIPANIVFLTLNIFALYLTQKNKSRSIGFAIAGLVLSALSVCLSLTAVIFPLALMTMSRL